MSDATGTADVWGADRVYPDGSFIFQCHLFGYQHLASLLPARARVLDVACGEGYGAAVLAARDGVTCVGVDLDPGLLARAADRYRAARFCAGDALRLPFPDGAFDAVGALQVIEHLPGERTDAFVDELARVCAPGGFVYVTTPNIDRLPATASKEFNPHHLRDFNIAELRAVLSRRFDDVTLFGQMLDESRAHVQALLAGAAREWSVIGRVERVERIVRALPGPARVRLRRILLRFSGIPVWPLPDAEAARAQVRAEDFRAAEPAEESGNTIAIARQPRRGT